MRSRGWQSCSAACRWPSGAPTSCITISPAWPTCCRRHSTQERFEFYGRTLNGQQEQQERWKRAIAALNEDLGEALGQLYVAQHFPPASKAKVLALVENLRAAYAYDIQHLPWMACRHEEGRAGEARRLPSEDRLSGQWRDYSALEIRPGDAFGNSSSARTCSSGGAS